MEREMEIATERDR